MNARQEINRIDIKEFREHGYLQEVNRQFFHPLGLALEVVVEEDGSERLGGVWDSRDDPEGFEYGADLLDAEKAVRVEVEQARKAEPRVRALGYLIQPVPGAEET